MLRSISQLYGNQLGASDGDFGRVKDFYFDDQNWAIRYLIADTGSWLPDRQVLLTPHSLGQLDQTGRIVRVNLTRKQIEESPSIESRKPVSPEYEEEYYRYYGWPRYWQGDDLWGASGVPDAGLRVASPAMDGSPVAAAQPRRAGSHLRSAQAVKGYQLRTSGGVLGHICDFMMDAQSWAIGQLVIRTGNRFSGREVLLPTRDVNRIDGGDSTVFATDSTAVVDK